MVEGRLRSRNFMMTKWLYLVCTFLFSGLLSFGAAPRTLPPAGPIPITERDFNNLFPLRNGFYTYAAFRQAAQELSKWEIQVEMKGPFLFRITRKDVQSGTASVVREDPGWNEAWAKEKPLQTFVVRFDEFGENANTVTEKKELAAFFAQIAHETRNGNNGAFNDGLMLLAEQNASSDYSSDNKIYPAVPGKKYFGRGPLQLSYNGNYGFVSDCIFGNKATLLNEPDLITKNAVIAFKSAICFWMMPQGAKPSAHQVMTGQWSPAAADRDNGRVPGFGMVTNIINGPLECNRGEGQENMLDRIGYYRAFLKKLNATDPNCACSCGKMQPY
jgi:hypothetical protein